MSATDRIRERALALDAAGLEAVLRALDADEVAQARAWVLAEKDFFAEVSQREPRLTRGYDRAVARELVGAGAWMQVMCQIALCSPAEAARAIHWGSLWGFMIPVARDHARSVLAAKPRAWAETFLTTTAALRLTKRDANRGGGQLGWVVSWGLADHDLPCPHGATFLEHAGGFSRHDPDAIAHFRGNRLNPDQVYLKIAAGFAYAYDALHEGVGELIGEGLLDRTKLLEVCLESLTTQTRVMSQRVVAKILTALDLHPVDVPGGLTFLTGVIATCDGSVGAALLPLALETVVEADDSSGLEDLTRVVAGRKERKQKQILLAWLRAPATVTAVGLPAVLGALEVLASGEEDAALLRGIEKARTELGAPVEPSADGPGVLGLWQLDLDPGPRRERPWWMRGDHWYELSTFLNRRVEEYKPATEYYIDDFVHSVTDEGSVVEFVELCRQLAVAGNLAVGRCVRLLEAAFLAGGLRVLWPAALTIADNAAAAGRTPPGLPDLLRLLTRYAPEVPDGGSLPPHLDHLAAATGSTKSQLEARALGAALARVGAADFTPGRVEKPETVVRGLWDLRPTGPVLGRLLDPYYPNYRGESDDNLKYLLAIGNGLADRRQGHNDGHARDANLLRELASCVQTGDLEEVRARFARSPRLPGTDQGPTWQALELWMSGRLTPSTYDDVLAADRTRGHALDRVVFAWTCEQLVRLPTHPGLLCSPALTDGTVHAARLANLLRSLAGHSTVGPLDLLLTLTRLQVAPDMVEEALALLDDVPSVWTDPAVTRTTTGVESFDVLPVIRAWITGNGMSGTGLPVDVGLFTGITEADLRGPASHEDVLYRVWPRRQNLPEHHVATYSGGGRTELQDGHLPAEAWGPLLSGMVSDYQWQRESYLTHIRELARFDGVLDKSVTVPTAVAWLSGGHLSLGRFSDGLQWLFERGGLRELWALGLEVAAAASTQTPKPAGLSSLLSGLSAYAHEVPDGERAVPPELTALAEAKSASKSRAAARALIEALDDGPETAADQRDTASRSA